MKVIKTLKLQDFNFWSGAKNHKFTNKELDEIEFMLEDIYHEGITETEINDLFWFDEETLCQWIGIDFDEYLNRNP